MAYEYEWKIVAADTDFSGLVYTSAVVDYVLRAVNQLMAEIDYAAYQIEDRENLLTPTVQTSVEFQEPMEIGDELTIELVPTISTSSITFRATGRLEGRQTFDAELTSVFVDASTKESVPVPEEVRTRLAEYLPNDGAA